MPILIGLIALLLTIMALNAYTKTSPALLAVIFKRGGGFLALALGALLLVRGRLDLGMALLGFGVWLMGLGGGALRRLSQSGGRRRRRIAGSISDDRNGARPLHGRYTRRDSGRDSTKARSSIHWRGLRSSNFTAFAAVTILTAPGS